MGAVAHLPFEGDAGRGFEIEGRPASDPGNGPNGTDSFVTLYDSSGDEEWTQTGLQAFF